jgi:hypothetical protein
MYLAQAMWKWPPVSAVPRVGLQIRRVLQLQRMPALRVQCYQTYVLPILLFGSEAWGLRVQQQNTLQSVHNGFLRQMLHMRCRD